jgi:hypothetical protein
VAGIPADHIPPGRGSPNQIGLTHLAVTQPAGDRTGDLSTGSVELTDVNAKAAAEGTEAKLEEVKADLVAGKTHVFDTSTFTVDGKELTSYKRIGKQNVRINFSSIFFKHHLWQHADTMLVKNIPDIIFCTYGFSYNCICYDPGYTQNNTNIIYTLRS